MDTTLKTPIRIIHVIGLFTLSALVWAYFGNIEQAAIAEGHVIPATEVKVIQNQDGGIVKEIAIKEGDHVKAGQLLLKLDDTRHISDYQTAKARYIALTAQVARLSAEADGKEMIAFPKELNAYPDVIKRENDLFSMRKKALTNETGLLKQRLTYANEQVDMFTKAYEKRIVAKTDLFQAQQQALAIKGALEATVNKTHEATLTELNAAKGDLATVTASLASLADKIKHSAITSPVDGIVKKLNVVTIGGVIQPGAEIMQVVPNDETLLIEAHVKPSDIGFIAVGQQATVKITAYDSSIYGDLKGVVEFISPDAIDDPKASVMSPNKTYYRVNIRTNKSYIGTGKHILPITPGMVANVFIKTGQKTVMQYLLKPIIKAKEEALRER